MRRSTQPNENTKTNDPKPINSIFNNPPKYNILILFKNKKPKQNSWTINLKYIEIFNLSSISPIITNGIEE